MEPTTTAPTRNIHAKISAVMSEIGAIGKNQRVDSPGAKYNYRGIDDLYNAVQPLLVKHGITVAPLVVPGTFQREVREVVAASGRVRLQTMIDFLLSVQFISTDDGSVMSVVVPAEGYDDSDKAAGKAMSYGMKNAYFHTFAIPTEDPDADRPSTEQSGDTQKYVDALLSATDMAALRSEWETIPAWARQDKGVTAAKDATKARLSGDK